MKSSTTTKFSADLEIRIVTSPFFIATKLEAFRGRGKGDFLGSYDLEDLVSVIDGCEALLSEVRRESDELRAYIAGEIPACSGPDAASQSRVGIV
jgi:hypothetical protein